MVGRELLNPQLLTINLFITGQPEGNSFELAKFI